MALTSCAIIEVRRLLSLWSLLQILLDLYGGDPCRAFRANFYRRKLEFDINTEEGQNKLQCLCRSYLEGLQWVGSNLG